MAATHVKRCKDCKRPAGPDLVLSRRSLCEACGWARQLSAITSMVDKDGEAYDRWQQRMKAAGFRV